MSKINTKLEVFLSICLLSIRDILEKSDFSELKDEDLIETLLKLERLSTIFEKFYRKKISSEMFFDYRKIRGFILNNSTGNDIINLLSKDDSENVSEQRYMKYIKYMK